jgi:hypothetical protein
MLETITRVPLSIGIWRRLVTKAKIPLGSVADRVQYGIFDYPHYAYGVYWSAYLASRLRLPRVTAIEFGVAGGRGLVALEKASMEIERALGIEIDVIGFDNGNGMPAPVDYRDLPHIWAQGFYRMDYDALKKRLKKAILIMGDVNETVGEWVRTSTAPVGFAAFDLDYYSSTKAALNIFEGSATTHLPRVHCYFDDVSRNAVACMNPYVGELLAIQEFNDSHDSRKISRIELMREQRPRYEPWQGKTCVMHDFQHPSYNEHVLPKLPKYTTQLPL